MSKRWAKIWAHGVDRAHQGPRREGLDYRVVPTVDRPLGAISLNDPSWVRAVGEALAAPVPSRAFEFWRQEGWLRHGLPEIDSLWGIPQPAQFHPEVDTGVHAMMVLDQAAAQGYTQRARWAALAHDFGKSITPRDKWPAHHAHEEAGVPLVQDRFKAWGLPRAIIDVAVAVTRHHGSVHRIASLRAPTILDIVESAQLETSDAHLVDFCQAVESDDRGRLGFFETPGRSTGALKAVVAGLHQDQASLIVEREAAWDKRLHRRDLVAREGKPLSPLTALDRHRFEVEHHRLHRIASIKRSMSAWRAQQGMTMPSPDEPAPASIPSAPQRFR